jgi:hypothetical protein
VTERDPLRDIEESLAFEVSADFSARVRRRIAIDPAPSRMAGSRWPAIAATVLLAAGVAAIATMRHVDVQVAEVRSPRTAGPSTVPVSRPPAIQTERAVSVKAVPAMVRIAKAERAAAYDIQVPDDQLRALDRLLAAMREGRATVPAQVSDVVVNDQGERVLRALSVEPLTIEPLAGTPAESNKNPGKDPNK